MTPGDAVPRPTDRQRHRQQIAGDKPEIADSNTDWGVSPTEPHVVAKSYVSDTPPRLAADAPNAPSQLAGLVEAEWQRESRRPIRVVSHAIAGTTSGGDSGTSARNRNGAPNARATLNGVTLFDGEVLGRAYPWSGGEPAGTAYPNGAIARVNAYVPGPNDFVYVSFGTNDFADDSIPPARTLGNLRWMLNRWTAAGHRADHLIFTTLAPRPDRPAVIEAIVGINAGVRRLAARSGAGLVDLSAYTSGRLSAGAPPRTRAPALGWPHHVDA